MKKIAVLVFIFIISLMLVGCEKKTSSRQTQVFNNGSQVSKTNQSSTSKNNTYGSTTKTTSKDTTTKLTTTTNGDDIYDGYYKMNNINFTYHDLGLSNEMFSWHFIDSVGDQNILVVPVKIKGTTSVTTQSTIDDLETTLFGDPEEDTDLYFESLKSYYYKSSYGKLNISGTITDWMGNYNESTFNTPSNQNDDALQALNDDFESFIATQNINKKDYDKDGDGFIDCVIFVYSCKDASQDESKDENYWAYTFSFENRANVNSPALGNYIWISYDFMYSPEANGKLDAHTFIHEYGHAMGQDDFYNGDARNGEDVTGCNIMMSYNVCDHDAFTKFSYGWINPYVVTGNCSITINPFQESGDAIILPILDDSVKTFDKNAFSEYIILEYYTATGLNEKDSKTSYGDTKGIDGSGIRAYYVDARLYYEISSDQYKLIDYVYEFDESKGTGLAVAYTNTPSYCQYEQNSRNKLLQLFDASKTKSGRSNQISFYNSSSCATQAVLYKNGSTLNTIDYYFHSKPTNRYTISFTLNADNTYTITFTKNS